ncbi:MAG: hypothetical protein A2Y73_02995 [Chloroflexi bacterium RBG_13_56_8]|nr:MAG: hypothetical protein A2Y73_02995 [Chloroflexi bacterium RBG_13_56_8]
MVVFLLALGFFLACARLELCAALVLGAIGAALFLLQPPLVLYALAFSVPFGSLVELSFGGVTLGPSEFLVFGLALAWLLKMATRREIPSLRSPLTFPLLLYLGTVVVSLWPARDLIPAVKELAKWLEFLVLYSFVASQMKRAALRPLLGALLVAGILQGAVGIYQFLRGVGPEAFLLMGRYLRAYGTFQQPNPFGGFMGLTLPLAYGIVLTTWREARVARRRGAWGPAVLWCLAILASGVTSASLIMSGSRGALLGLVGGAVLVSLALGRRAWPIIVVVGAVALVALGTLPGISDLLVGRVLDTAQYLQVEDLASVEITDENFAVIERLAHWQAAWRMFSLKPWLGVGIGQYAAVYPQVSLPRWADPLGHAHNYYLNTLAEGGLVGLAAYLLLFLAALAMSWRAAWRERGWRRGLALGALGMLGHLLFQSVFDNLYVHEMYLWVAMVLGMVATLSPEESDRGEVALFPDTPDLCRGA